MCLATNIPPQGDSQLDVIQSEFVFHEAPFASCHASTLVESKGHLVAAWFGGSAESHPDVGIWLSRFQEEVWTPPIEVANGIESAEKRYPCWNPVLFQPIQGPMLLFYKVGPRPNSWWGMLMTSSDGGATWSKPIRLPDGILGPIKNKPIELRDGTIICPSSSESPSKGWRVHFERSEDRGKTWTATPALNDGITISAIQPSLLEHKDGCLAAIGRSKQERLFHVTSQDAGRTWSKMTLLDVPNPNSGTDALTLRDGRFLLVYNNTPRGRTPLNVALSVDGVHWQTVLTLEDNVGEFSYPAVIQTRDGRIHISYTWNRKFIKHVILDKV